MKNWLIVTGALLLLFGVIPMLIPQFGHPQLMIVLCLAAFPAFVIARINQSVASKDQDQAFMFQMGSIMGRMFFSLMALGIFLYFQPQTFDLKVTAIVWFFLAYLSYAAVEVNAFLANLRRN
jgi:hypothetical protein